MDQRRHVSDAAWAKIERAYDRKCERESIEKIYLKEGTVLLSAEEFDTLHADIRKWRARARILKAMLDAYAGDTQIVAVAIESAARVNKALLQQGRRLCTCESAPQGLCCCGGAA